MADHAVVRAFPVSGRPGTHARPFLDGVVPVLIAMLSATLLWLAVFGEPAHRRLVTAVVTIGLLGVLTAITVDLVRMPELSPAERRPWRTLLVAFSLFLTSSALGQLQPLLGVDAQSLRQLVIVSGFGTMVLALFRFPAAPQTRLPRARFVLDAATVFASSTIFLWHYLIAPQLQRGGLDGRLAVLVVAVIGMMAVFVVAMVMLLLRERTAAARAAQARLVIGVGLVLGLMVLSLTQGLSGDRPRELWTIALNWSALVLVVSAVVQQRRLALLEKQELPSAEPRIAVVLPYGAVALAFGFLLWAGLREAPLELRGVLVGAAVVGVCVLIRQRLLLQENEALRHALEEQATRDPLTGLRNRRSWEREAEREIERAARYGSPLSVLVIDIDDFKSVNDGHGHEIGDAVLRAVAGCLVDGLRTSDLAARTGGDEFVVLLPETGVSDAMRLGQMLRERVAARPVESDGVAVSFTASIGVAGMPTGGTLRQLVALGDAAMYDAKREGRNRVRSGTPALVVMPLREAGRSR